MAWCWIGTKPLSEPVLTQFIDAYMRHQGEMKHYSDISWASHFIKSPGTWLFCHSLSRLATKKTKLCAIGLFWENPLMTARIPSQRASNVENFPGGPTVTGEMPSQRTSDGQSVWGESIGDWWSPSQRASNVESVSIWCCHHRPCLLIMQVDLWPPSPKVAWQSALCNPCIMKPLSPVIICNLFPLDVPLASSPVLP